MTVQRIRTSGVIRGRSTLTTKVAEYPLYSFSDYAANPDPEYFRIVLLILNEMF